MVFINYPLGGTTVEDRKKPKNPPPSEQEPGEVPAWMTWVAKEDQATRTDVKAEIKEVREEVRATRTELKAENQATRTELKADIKASEERQAQLLCTEIRGSESRMVLKTTIIMAAIVGVAVAYLSFVQGIRSNLPVAAPVPIEVIISVPEELADSVQARVAAPDAAQAAGGAAPTAAAADPLPPAPAEPPAAGAKPAAAAADEGPAGTGALPAEVAAATGGAVAGAASQPARE